MASQTHLSASEEEEKAPYSFSDLIAKSHPLPSLPSPSAAEVVAPVVDTEDDEKPGNDNWDGQDSDEDDDAVVVTGASGRRRVAPLGNNKQRGWATVPNQASNISGSSSQSSGSSIHNVGASQVSPSSSSSLTSISSLVENCEAEQLAASPTHCILTSNTTAADPADSADPAATLSPAPARKSKPKLTKKRKSTFDDTSTEEIIPVSKRKASALAARATLLLAPNFSSNGKSKGKLRLSSSNEDGEDDVHQTRRVKDEEGDEVAIPPPAKRRASRVALVPDTSSKGKGKANSQSKRKPYDDDDGYVGPSLPKLNTAPRSPKKARKRQEEDPSPAVHSSFTLQSTRCLSTKYKEFSLCHICTSRKTGQLGCAFMNVRSFSTSAHGTPIAPAFVSHPTLEETPTFRTRFNQEFTLEHAVKVGSKAAHALLPTMRLEAAHAQKEGAMQVNQELGTRSTCDTCLHTILSGSWLCTGCGREICFACCEHVEKIEAEYSTSGKTDGKQFKEYSEEEKRLRRCKVGGLHGKKEMLPMTRFRNGEAENTVEEMDKWLTAHPYIDPILLPLQERDAFYQLDSHSFTSPLSESHPYLYVPALAPNASNAAIARNDDFPFLTSLPTIPSPPSTTPPPISNQQLSVADSDSEAKVADLFHALWPLGEPIVTDVGISERSVLCWSPAYFIKEFGDVPCKIASNFTGQVKSSTVGDFFKTFGVPRPAGDSWKIKDWPSQSDLRDDFPSLFKDYMRAIPVGEVTRRDGVLNIAAHTPLNANPPDLGPKGYFSQASDDSEGGQGSTKLHSDGKLSVPPFRSFCSFFLRRIFPTSVVQDVADALNLMLFAGPAPDGGPGRAAWDLYRAEDSELIRDFLYEIIAARPEHSGLTVAQLRLSHDDPIHGQNVYLDETLRARLLEEKGVKSWRIWQSPGQVVFIPAGFVPSSILCCLPD
ncbi:hypothetical protein P7C70_g2928, partial [Phenoliferia sp. Uapishka_3]